MHINLTKEESDVIEGLKNIYKQHRKSSRFVSNDSPICKLEAASTRLIMLMNDIQKRYNCTYVAVVKAGEIVLYQEQKDGSLTPVSYCEVR